MNFRIPTALLAVALAVALAGPATTSAAGKAGQVKFSGSYSGTVSMLIKGSSIKVLSVAGKGTASVIGKSKLSGTASGTSAGSSSCVPFKGTGKIKGANGTLKLSTTIKKAKGCSSGQSGPVTITVSGTATVTGAAGKAKGATGSSLKFNGTLHLKDTSGSQSGKFKATISGKLK
jgi:hypothetical protein